MAYPTSVFSPATRSNGQTIDAAHVNDVQAEITAVEDALLGTITHSLNITGASTLATLQAAASTFSVRPMTPPPEAALVYLASTYTIGSSADSTINWTGQQILTNSSMHSTATNPSRLIPQSTGLYRMDFQLTISSVNAGSRQLLVQDSSGEQLGTVMVPGSSHVTRLGMFCYKRFDVVGGYAVSRLYQTGASTLSLFAAVGESWFSLVKL